MIGKGQARWVSGSDIRRQNQINELREIGGVGKRTRTGDMKISLVLVGKTGAGSGYGRAELAGRSWEDVCALSQC